MIIHHFEDGLENLMDGVHGFTYLRGKLYDISVVFHAILTSNIGCSEYFLWEFSQKKKKDPLGCGSCNKMKDKTKQHPTKNFVQLKLVKRKDMYSQMRAKPYKSEQL